MRKIFCVADCGAKLKLLEIACRNAEESFRRRSPEKQKELSLLQRVKDSLSLSKIPFSIECFDISNIQGNIAAASMVRFEDGKPAKSRYRRNKIKTVFGANDYAMIYEVLQRRLKRAEEEAWEAPELMLMDGGKGQLNIVHQVLSELGFLYKVKLASIA